MRTEARSLTVLLVAAACGACVGSLGGDEDESGYVDSSGNGSGSGSGAAASTGSGNTTPSGLPCEVAEVVQAHCASCHGDPPTSSAPQALLTPSDWRAPSKSDPAKSNGQVSVERMHDVEAPMPPGDPMSAAAIAIVEDWVLAGMPEGDCETMNVDDPLLTADPICTSMDMWPAMADEVQGKNRSEMFPGMPCIDCHENPGNYGFDDNGRAFALAGTIFPTGHEPDRCAGAPGGSIPDLAIHIEDANGKKWDLRPDASGNFSIRSTDPVAFPYSAKVVSADGERVMVGKVSNGDCNLCHTQDGSKGPNPMDPAAPGRIVPPLPKP